MHPRIGAVNDVYVSTIVDFRVVRLNRNLAAFTAAGLGYTAFVGLLCDRGNVIADLFGTIRIANIDRAHAGIEVRDKDHALIIDRRKGLVARMGAKTAATLAKITARFNYIEVGYRKRSLLVGNVNEKNRVAKFAAFILRRFRDNHDEVGTLAFFHLGELRHRHP